MRATLFARAAVGALTLALCLGSASAEESQASRREAAKVLVAQGTALYHENAFAEALARFRAAYAVYPNPKIYFDIAQAAAHLNDTITAANAYQSFLDQTLEAEALSKARASAREQLGKLTQKLARLSVIVEPPAAEVRIDGTVVPDHASYLAPGRHEVTLSRQGYVGHTESVELAAAQLRTLTVALKQVPPPPVVLVGPQDVPTAKPAPQVAPQPAPAPAAGGLSEQVERPSTTPAWATIGAGAAVTVAGAVLGVLALGDNSKLSALVAGDPSSGLHPGDAPGLRSRLRTESTLSTVAVPLGVAALGVGTYLLLSRGSGDPKPQNP